MTAYYNEIDEYAASILESLIARNLIPKGDVDRRRVEEVKPDDIKGYKQHHFFAGIGGWPYAFRLAGWPDEKPVWSGSVPCQPFSSAGKRAGIDDDRHLWPAFFRLIAECRPTVAFGEQVSGNLGRTWLAALRLDLESIGYACGAADLPAASVGAPHRRNRLFWMAHATGEHVRNNTGNAERWRLQHREPSGEINEDRTAEHYWKENSGISDTSGGRREQRFMDRQKTGTFMAESAHGDTTNDGICIPDSKRWDQGEFSTERRSEECISVATSRNDDGVCHSDSERLERHARNVAQLNESGWHGPFAYGPGSSPSVWSNVVYLPYRDGKWRPVTPEPGIFPLAHGVSKRVAKLRVVGNAIVPQLAAAFILATGILEQDDERVKK